MTSHGQKVPHLFRGRPLRSQCSTLFRPLGSPLWTPPRTVMPGGEDNTFDGQNHAVKVADSTLISSSYIYQIFIYCGQEVPMWFLHSCFFCCNFGGIIPFIPRLCTELSIYVRCDWCRLRPPETTTVGLSASGIKSH